MKLDLQKCMSERMRVLLISYDLGGEFGNSRGKIPGWLLVFANGNGVFAMSFGLKQALIRLF